MKIAKSDQNIIFSAVGIFSCALIVVVFLVSRMAVASEDLSKPVPTAAQLIQAAKEAKN